MGKNTEKYKKFSVSINKVTKIDKDGNKTVLIISYNITFIDSARFMASSFSYLVDNHAERIHKIKCKGYDCFLEYESVYQIMIKYKCLSCNENYSNKIKKELKKQFKNTFKFNNNDINIYFVVNKRCLSFRVYG